MAAAVIDADLLRIGALALRRAQVAAPLVAGALLPLLAWAVPHPPDPLAVLRWAGLLLACAWLAAVDEPSTEVANASPHPGAVRLAHRVGAVGLVVVPVWTAASVLVRWRDPGVPTASLTLEFVSLSVVGVAIAAGLRARRHGDPQAHLAAAALVVGFGAAQAMPRWYALFAGQTWGPPFVAAHLRWAAVLLLGTAIIAAAVRDPLERRG